MNAGMFGKWFMVYGKGNYQIGARTDDPPNAIHDKPSTINHEP
jgi:hypothetical protein